MNNRAIIGEAFEQLNRMPRMKDSRTSSVKSTGLLKEDLADEFKEIHDKDEYLWNLHNTDYSFIYDELKKYMQDGETWDESGEDGYPLDTNVDIRTLFARMPQDKQVDLFCKLVDPLKKDECLKESYRVGKYQDDYVVIDLDGKLHRSETGQILRFPTKKEAEEYINDELNKDESCKKKLRESEDGDRIVQYSIDIVQKDSDSSFFMEQKIAELLENGGIEVAGCMATDASWTIDEYHYN